MVGKYDTDWEDCDISKALERTNSAQTIEVIQEILRFFMNEQGIKIQTKSTTYTDSRGLDYPSSPKFRVVRDPILYMKNKKSNP